jgi:RNA binding exosome subunit
LSSKPFKLPIGYITVRVFAHATEDQEKVLAAVRNTLPKELVENAIFKKTSLTGHHGNLIVLFEAEFTNIKVLPAALEKIGSGLTALDRETLSSEVNLHLEKGNLFLRFDKQYAFLGELRFSLNDPIHFKIHFRNRTVDEIIEICRQAGLLS